MPANKFIFFLSFQFFCWIFFGSFGFVSFVASHRFSNFRPNFSIFLCVLFVCTWAQLLILVCHFQPFPFNWKYFVLLCFRQTLLTAKKWTTDFRFLNCCDCVFTEREMRKNGIIWIGNVQKWHFYKKQKRMTKSVVDDKWRQERIKTRII